MMYKLNDMEELKDYEIELAEILESNISRKDVFVERLQSHHSDHAQDIKELFETWQELQNLEIPKVRSEMDSSFYRMLDALPAASTSVGPQPRQGEEPTKMRWLSPTRIAIAATFLIGLMAGHLLDFSNSTDREEQYAAQSVKNDHVKFASLEETPSALRRIKEIYQVRSQDNPDMRIIDALNQVILHDPNINVRLTGIETMVAFSHIPEARAYLIEAIPYQESPIVQLELADVMAELEEKNSVDQWNELLQSDKTDTETRIHLKESLRKIL